MVARLSLSLGLGVIALAALVSSVMAQQAGDPAAVMTAYEMARNRGDLDAALGYFADDATVTQRSTVIRGKDEIRRYLQTAVARGRSVQIANRRVSGSQLTWLERPPAGNNNNTFEVNVEATVHEGKIKTLVYSGGVATARSELAPDGRAPLPALLGLGAVIALFGGVMLLASSGFGAAGGHSSRLRGRMHQDLQGWQAARGLNG